MPRPTRPVADADPITHPVSQRGTIARMVLDRGFCFITGSDGQDYFCHMTALQDGPLDEYQIGQAVTFTPTQTPKGRRAELVRRG